MKILWLSFLNRGKEQSVVRDRRIFFEENGVSSLSLAFSFCFSKYIYMVRNMLFGKPVRDCQEIFSVSDNVILWSHVVGMTGLVFNELDAFYRIVDNKLNVSSFDVIYAHTVNLQSIVAYKLHRRYGVPYVIMIHGDIKHAFISKIPYIKKYFIPSLVAASKILFVSRETMKQNLLYVKGYSEYLYKYLKNKSAVAYNGIDLQMFYPINKNSAKKEVFPSDIYDETEVIVGYVGRLDYEKNVHLLPELAEIIERKIGRRVRLLIIGSGPLSYVIESWASGRNKVTYVGFVDRKKLNLYYNAMDVLLLPSRSEGFPTVILEALAAGTPVIATNVGGIPEVLPEYMMLDKNDPLESLGYLDLAAILKRPRSYYRSIVRENFDKRYLYEREIIMFEDIMRSDTR